MRSAFTKEQFEALPVIELSGLEGNEPTTLNTLQELFVVHVSDIVLIWWAVWFFVLFYVVYTYVYLPLRTRHKA